MVKDFGSSIKSYLKAIKIISKLKLWKYFFVPAILGFIIGSIFIVSAFSFSDNLGLLISNNWKWEFGKEAISMLSAWIAGLSILIIGIIMYKHILMALSSPFMTPLSEKIESHLRGFDINDVEPKSNIYNQLLRSIKLNIVLLFKELLITIPLMILTLIPLIGLISTFFIFYYQSFYTGVGNMDYTLERHLDYSESKKFIKKYKGIAIGNGFIFTLMLFIPFIGIMITLPISTVASTIDTVEKLHPKNSLTS